VVEIKKDKAKDLENDLLSGDKINSIDRSAQDTFQNNRLPGNGNVPLVKPPIQQTIQEDD
jgi:hypothetical protein